MKRLKRKLHYLKRTREIRQLNKGAVINKQPILMLGNQKSGTTVIASLLSQLTDLSASVGIFGIREPNQTKLYRGKLSFSEFVERNKYDFSKQIVKEPSLTFFHEEAADYFPEAKFVFIIRDPRDNIRSILNRVDIPGDDSKLDEEKFRAATLDWQKIVDSRWLGIEGKDYIEWLAYRWNLCASIYLKNQSNMILFKYEDFMKDKAGEIERLADQLGLEKKQDIRDKVDVQYERAGNRNVKKLAFFGEENLSKIETICGEYMEALQYQKS